MPIALPNLYVTPQDIYEFVGIDAAQLRLDDQNQASGQQIQASADAVIGATTITLANGLQYPLLRGTNLTFSDAQMSQPVTAVLNAVANAAATSLSIVPLATQINSGGVAIDNGVNVWLAGLLVKACQIATAKCKLYLCNIYDDSQLVLSWSVNQWATAIGARWLGTRRFMAAPENVQQAYDEAIEEMKAVAAGQLSIEDIGTRTSAWPFLSNISINDGFTFRKLRVEWPISEQTPTQYPQSVDWSSFYAIEW
jgi:hypothetical protein